MSPDTPNAMGLKVPDPDAARIARDRALALEFVLRNEGRGVPRQLAEETGVRFRTVHRAIKREIEWARSVVGAEATPEAHSGGSAPVSDSHSSTEAA
jgi:hypothetical protein